MLSRKAATVIGGLALVVLALVAVGSAAPQPRVAPASWTLDFRYEDPQRIVIPGVGESRPRVFWYMLYTVANNSGADVEFYPRFELKAGATQILLHHQDVPSNVFAAIRQRHQSTRPFLQSPARIIGTLQQGEDYAKDGVAVWPQFDADADEFTIYVRGLSGETDQVPNSSYDPARPEAEEEVLADGTTVPRVVNTRYFTVHKTLAITYQLPGDRETRIQASPVRLSQKWIMR